MTEKEAAAVAWIEVLANLKPGGPIDWTKYVDHAGATLKAMLARPTMPEEPSEEVLLKAICEPLDVRPGDARFAYTLMQASLSYIPKVHIHIVEGEMEVPA